MIICYLIHKQSAIFVDSQRRGTVLLTCVCLDIFTTDKGEKTVFIHSIQKRKLIREGRGLSFKRFVLEIRVIKRIDENCSHQIF